MWVDFQKPIYAGNVCICRSFERMRQAAAQLLSQRSQFGNCRVVLNNPGLGQCVNWQASFACRTIVKAAKLKTRTTKPQGYGPQPSHKPNTGQEEHQVYVLTLNLSPSISVPLDQMREEYFPKHLNRTPAHITLFHALPHSQFEVIDAELNRMASRTRPYHISTGTPFRLKRGVAVLLGSGEEQSQHLREELREQWTQWLSQQDNSSRGWQPHWTVMNKVEEEKKVQSAFNTLRRILFDEVHHGKALGFDLWKYNSGNWEHAKMYRFEGHERHGGRTSDGVEGESYGYFEQRRKSRGNELKSPEDGLQKSNSRTRMADMWRTVTLAKKKSGHEAEQR